MNQRHRLVKVVVVVLLAGVGCSPVWAADVTAGQERASGGQLRDHVATPAALAEPTGLVDRRPSAAPLALAEGGGVLPPSVPVPAAEPPGTIVAHVEDDEIVAYRDRGGAEPLQTFANPTEFGGPRVFQAVGPVEDGWLEVLLPVRPNGTTGWIKADEVDLTVNPYRIELDTSAYQLQVFRADEVTLTTTVALGDGDTPTPLGRFYLIELLRPTDQNGPYGSYAYGLSGYSDTLESFNGGAGVIGIHGTNQPELLGQNVSHGCIRVANPTIEEMVGFLPLGTPVHIFHSDRIASGQGDQARSF